MAGSLHMTYIDQTVAMRPQNLFLNKFLILCFIFHFCTCNDTLTPAKSINDGEILVSAGKNFALGFFVPGNSSNRYVGIWYYKILEQIIVWVANRDNPIAKNSSGVLTINSQGNLVILDKGTNTSVWSTNLSITVSDRNSNLAAKLLDSGNLVLMTSNNSENFVWQSFDYPSDSMLPGMKIGLRPRLGLNCSLTSWKSRDNPGHGNYSFELQLRGTPQFFVYKGDDKIWRSGPWNGLRLSTMPDTPVPSEIFMEGFVNTPDEISLTDVSTSATLSRLLLDESGSLQRQIWIDQNRQWNTLWSSSRDRCESYGACGAYAICGSRIPMQCSCLPGFKPKIPYDWNLGYGSEGCVRKRAAQCGNGEGFLMISHVKVPDTSVSHVDMSLSLKECKQKCLSDCSCTAYTAADIRGEGSGCLSWYGDLIDIMGFASGGQDLFVRVDATELAENTQSDAKGFHGKMWMLMFTLVTLLAGFFLLVTCGCCYFKKWRKTKGKKGGQGVSFFARLNDPPSAEDLEETTISSELSFFTLNVILTATENFSPSNKLGEGGFGPVFKGRLTNGQEIAVKRLSKSSGQGTKEFKNEVKLITKLQHRNLVKILGCCICKEEKMLVYEYMVNKSLDYFIFDKSRRPLLDWNDRMRIMVGTARGVLYLHQDSRLRIIHRDLKVSNILLDADMNPKISDFGIARIFGGAHTEESTRRVVGTYGYMAPEYAIDGVFSVKSDVFSFGVLLLEVISGKRSSGYYHEDLSMNLIAYVWNLWKEGIALDVVDSCLADTYPSHEALRCIQVGLLCVQESASDRPTMSDVVFMLVNDTNLPIPKQPAFVISKTYDNANSSEGGTASGSVNLVTITTMEAR